MTLTNFSSSTFQNLFNIRQSPTYVLQNEYKFVPIIKNSERLSFENKTRLLLPDDNFEIRDVGFNGTVPTFTYAGNRSFYCPLSWIAPRETKDFIPFIGVDLCNVITWKQIIEQMNNNTESISVNYRGVITQNQSVVDMGMPILGYNFSLFFIF